ncbi:MAG: N-acetylmuramic acid 6-phosphate etherase [Myxococcaceae bacterium]|nr:N-acetylmuramic acid 6-phosphate etherase [Myxococcaceae bacterium]
MKYAQLPTEAVHPRADELDGASTRALVRALNREDAVAVRAVGEAGAAVAALADALVETIRRRGRLYYVGAGTSGRLGALDAAEWPPTFGTPRTLAVAVLAGGPRAMRTAIEEVEAQPAAGARAMRAVRPVDLVVGITASGTTPFVLGALAEARRRGATTALVTSNPHAKTRVDHRVTADTGAELVAGSTRLKAGTATKLILNAVSTAAMIRLGRVKRGRMAFLQPLNPKLRARAKRIARDLG